MLHIPVVGIAIVLGGIIATTLATGKAGVKRLNPVAIGILGPDAALVLAENIFIVGGAFQEELVIGIISQSLGNLGGAPVIVALGFRNGDGLSAFAGMNGGKRFFFT